MKTYVQAVTTPRTKRGAKTYVPVNAAVGSTEKYRSATLPTDPYGLPRIKLNTTPNKQNPKVIPRPGFGTSNFISYGSRGGAKGFNPELVQPGSYPFNDRPNTEPWSYSTRPGIDPDPIHDMDPYIHNPDYDYYRVFIDDVEVFYYVPTYTGLGPAPTREFLVAVHGAGDCHYAGAATSVTQFVDFADAHNVVVIAPAFTAKYDLREDRGFPPGFVESDWVDPWWYFAWSWREIVCRAYAYCRAADNQGIPDIGLYEPERTDYHYHDFQRLVNTQNPLRSDRALNAIAGVFRANFPDAVERFSLFGHSGGGQFASRYMMVHPQNLKRVALSGGKTYLFPRFDQPFPFGLNVAMMDSAYGGPSRPSDYVADLAAITEEGWIERFVELHRFPVFFGVGTSDTDQSTAATWQGNGRYERAVNLSKELSRFRTISRFKRPLAWTDDTNFEPVFLWFAGVDHGGTLGSLRRFLIDYGWLYKFGDAIYLKNSEWKFAT